jgi:hypothetical protein
MAVTIKLPFFEDQTSVTVAGYSEAGSLLQSSIAMTESAVPGLYTGSLSFATFPVGYYDLRVYIGAATVASASWAIRVTADGTTADYADSIGELRRWATNQTEHDATQAAVAGISLTGSGARTVTITVTDGTNPLASALVRITSGVNTFTSSTNGSGVVVFNLDDATWVVSITKSGYTYAGSSIVVDGTETATLAMTAIAFPVSPAGQVTGYWYVYNVSGAVESGAVILVSSANPAKGSTGLVLQDDSRTITADGNGLASVSNLFPGSSYKVKRQGSSREFIITVPAGATSPVALGSIVG